MPGDSDKRQANYIGVIFFSLLNQIAESETLRQCVPLATILFASVPFSIAVLAQFFAVIYICAIFHLHDNCIGAFFHLVS